MDKLRWNLDIYIINNKIKLNSIIINFYIILLLKKIAKAIFFKIRRRRIIFNKEINNYIIRYR